MDAKPQAVLNLIAGLKGCKEDVLPGLSRLWRDGDERPATRSWQVRVGLALMASDAAAVKGGEEHQAAALVWTREIHTSVMVRLLGSREGKLRVSGSCIPAGERARPGGETT
jgi:hypothetical protein